MPLFYEPSLRLPIDDRPQTPYFFRFGDLQTAFEAQREAGGAEAAALNDTPSPRVVSLSRLIQGFESGAVSPDSLLVAAAEASAVVARMNGMDAGGGAAAGGAGAPAGPGGAPPRPSAPRGEEFFLSVPFANGRRM